MNPSISLRFMSIMGLISACCVGLGGMIKNSYLIGLGGILMAIANIIVFIFCAEPCNDISHTGMKCVKSKNHNDRKHTNGKGFTWWR